jgi:hypothetical protein
MPSLSTAEYPPSFSAVGRVDENEKAKEKKKKHCKQTCF